MVRLRMYVLLTTAAPDLFLVDASVEQWEALRIYWHLVFAPVYCCEPVYQYQFTNILVLQYRS